MEVTKEEVYMFIQYLWEEEIWKDIEGYEGLYQVSNLGRVRSVIRVVVDRKCTRCMKSKILKQTPSTGKLPYFYVSLSKGGKVQKRMVHRLVAETFIPNVELKPQVNHIDGNPQNNRYDNLEWMTNAENTLHAYRTHLNMGRQKLFTIKGKTLNMTQWCEVMGIKTQKLSYLMKKGWTVERALNEFAYRKGMIS